jgi:SpoVK/Ycf46/Vps4 family AAA+-type ATPase
VAESLARPLYRVNGSDLGSTSDEIENNLQLVFGRVARWEAILLLDEADAYMAERQDDSLDRNTLVSSTVPYYPTMLTGYGLSDS